MYSRATPSAVVFVITAVLLSLFTALPAASSESYWSLRFSGIGTDDVTDNRGTKTTFSRAYRIDFALGFEDLNPVTDRFELEFSYRNAQVDKLSNALVPGRRVDGEIIYYATFLNAYHDVDYLSFRYGNRWTPFVGGGAGLARVEADNVAANTSIFNTTDDADEVFLYQGMTGLSYAYSPHTDVTLGYRFTESNDVTWRDSGGNLIQAGVVTDHQFRFGFHWRFF